ncbi:Gfo/Idh/MocA family protein [Sphingomonas profundi]|uniref:Gfo/Idh/MocA family protein n=1 Tax=Alterirhizorhabdus profundi TaxID=2681549 RepID=UPI0012E780C5|nr:Gfo/Idh/MocA family oxidoreductase [Sphingomonas profundi]
MKRYGVGIIGLQPGASWAAAAHLPALRALADDFAIVGVANSSAGSAEAAVAACDAGRAFADAAALVAAPDVDIVAVTVKVPHHHALVAMAIAAGKHVYCEWPLGNGLAEAEDLAAQADAAGVLGVIGTQARLAPAIVAAGRMVAEGYLGELLSTTLVATGLSWGPVLEPRNAYLADRANGATMLTIPFGHTMAAVRDVLGPVAELSATLATRRPVVRNGDMGAEIAMDAPDQVLVQGVLAGGAPIAIHYRGGTPGGTGLLWEIEGTAGTIRVSGPGGHSQLVPLTLSAGRTGEALTEVDVAEHDGLPADPVAGNVARVYRAMAADLRDGTRTAPRFADAVPLHRLIAAVEAADASGRRTAVPG